jgi:hypothetical protein
MELQIENIIAAYNTADDNSKNLLRTMFPNVEFEGDKQADNRPITERIKTFEDACKELGEEHLFVKQYNSNEMDDLDAYLKLRIICAALNEGWKPEFTEDEYRWYPWFYLYTQEELDDMEDLEKKDHRIIDTGDYATEYAGFGSAYSLSAPPFTAACVGSRLCLRSSELAVYCGKQFIKLWADFNLIRK